ncbi:MAG: hypothetical protein ACYDHO_02580 [Gaiellaceae bacterium]
MTRRPKGGAAASPKRSEAELRKQSERRREVVLLGLVLLGIAVFFIGYATGRSDDTFRTNWYSPLKGTNAAPQTFGSVQGGPIDPGGNTPLLVTVRGLPILTGSKHYVLYVLDAKRSPSPCGTFSVGEGTTRVELSFPGLPEEPHGWRIAREKPGTRGMGEIVARTAWR